MFEKQQTQGKTLPLDALDDFWAPASINSIARKVYAVSDESRQ
jgi:hypothetical protein